MNRSFFEVSFFEMATGVAGSVFALSLLFCGFESVPGWETFHVGWPPWVYFAIVLVTGSLAGAAFGGRYWLPGAFGGALAGTGALFSISLPLLVLPIINRALLYVFGAFGCLPGVGLFWLLRMLQDRIREGIEKRSSPLTRIPDSAWPKALRREPGEGR